MRQGSGEGDAIARYGERALQSLEDLLEHGEAAARLVARGKDAYDADEMLRYAAEDLLIRAGEAVNRVDKAGSGFIDDYPALELRKLKDTRNVIAHGYDIVDAEIVWTILAVHLPRVLLGVGRIIST